MKTVPTGVLKIKFSLKTKMLVAVTLLIAILLTTTGAIFSQFFRDQLKNSISAQNFTLVSSLAREVDGKLWTTREHLSGIARMVTPEVVSVPDKAMAFLETQSTNKILFDDGLVLLSPSFSVLASIGKSLYSSSQNFPFENCLKKTLLTKAPANFRALFHHPVGSASGGHVYLTGSQPGWAGYRDFSWQRRFAEQ